MPPTSQFEFNQLDFPELQTLVGWAQQEGWNPGPQDAAAFWAADPDGFYGFLDDGELIAGGAIVSYGGAYGFMGLFIVRPDYRGKGIGEQLWFKRRDTLLARLNPGAAIGMDGVEAMQPFYNRGGFEIAFRDERYENTGAVVPVDPRVAAISPSDFPRILAFDTACFGVSRPEFLNVWLQLDQGNAFQFRDGDTLRGYAVLRPVANGFKIGPLFADNSQVAEALYCACLAAAPGAPVYLDIPLNNANAVALVAKYQASPVFACARMYYGRPQTNDMSKVYGITTFELG